MRAKSMIKGIAVSIVLGSSCLAHANLIVNGSFEDGPLLNGNPFVMVAPGSTVITGWTVGGNGIDYAGPGTWNISDGLRNIDLDASKGFNDNGAIYQTFATTIGQQYSASFDLSGNPSYYPIIKGLRVDAGANSQDFTYDIGEVNYGNLPLTIGYSRETFLFTAIANLSTLTFTSLTNLTGITSYGPIIDNVVVEAVNQPVPEPATFLLFSLGIASAGGLRFRNRKR